MIHNELEVQLTNTQNPGKRRGMGENGEYVDMKKCCGGQRINLLELQLSHLG